MRPHILAGCLLMIALLAVSQATGQITLNPQCNSTFDARGQHNVFNPYASPSKDFLFLVAANVLDDGESTRNFVSPTGDIGLQVYSGPGLTGQLNNVRMFGPYYEGPDTDRTLKYEWLSDCSMRYNNFAIMEVSGYQGRSVRIRAVEGDDAPKFIPGHEDDVVFDAVVQLDRIGAQPTGVTGTCDIRGKCATLWFAVRHCSSGGCGTFWPAGIRPVLRPMPNRNLNRAIKGAVIANPELLLDEKIFVGGYNTVTKIFHEAKDLLGTWPHKWVQIEYVDGYRLFNRFKAERTMEDMLKHARGEGDCDWWDWPESAHHHVCLNSYPRALQLTQIHGKIRDIRWIDHPTAPGGPRPPVAPGSAGDILAVRTRLLQYRADRSRPTSLQEAEQMLRASGVGQITARTNAYVSGQVAPTLEITLWPNTYGKSRCYGARYGNPAPGRPYFGSNATYFEVCKPA